MPLATDYPFLNIFWSMIIFFCWVAWIWLLIVILGDVFRRERSGWAKARWCVVLIVVPFLGTLIYLIAHGNDMTARRIHEAQVSQAHFDDYVKTVSSNGGA